jgi:serine/threonine protein kinase
MHVLIIDDDPGYREVLRYHLDVEWPDAVIEEYQPPMAGPIADSHSIGHYDVILLGHPICGENGFECLSALRRRQNCPPIVLFADPSDELLAVDAIAAGAASYFPKSRVKHQRLIEVIRTAAGTSGHARAEAALLSGTPSLSAKHYRFIETLHSSDIAAVYLAETADGGTRTAFKVIRYVPDSGSERLFDRFLQEYEIVARLDHPNVVKIFDLGVADDHAYIAMEYLPAGSLAERLSEPLAPERVLAYLRQIGGALGAIHDSGILHRDLKPANIMFRDDETLALIDFGLAKQMEMEAGETFAGKIFGTPYYMSPEQGHAEPADPRSDIYSLGCVCYEMLTGQRPFTAGSPLGVIYKHAHALRPRLEAPLSGWQPVLDRMLAVAPADRYQSVAELMDGLYAL